MRKGKGRSKPRLLHSRTALSLRCALPGATHCCSMAMRQVTHSMGLQGGDGGYQGSAVQSMGCVAKAKESSALCTPLHQLQLSRRGHEECSCACMVRRQRFAPRHQPFQTDATLEASLGPCTACL